MTDSIRTGGRTYLIIGGGVAGKEAASAVRRLDGEGEIVLLSRESVPPYNRPFLTRVLAPDCAMDRFFIEKEEWYQKNRIRLLLGRTVTAVDAAARTVTTAEGERLSYDRLLLATGAVCNMPIPCAADMGGVFTLRSYEDAMRIREYAKGVRSAVIVGGGPLGLEAAESLHRTGIEVTVVERADRLMGLQLNDAAAGLLADRLRGEGLRVRLSRTVRQAEGEKAVRAVALDDGTHIEARLLLVSAGVRADVSLAKQAGLSVDRGILTDDRLRTSAEGVYAAGDCAQVDGELHGLWPAALEMGRIAGANMAGEEQAYVYRAPAVLLNVFGIHLFSAGQVCGEGLETDERPADGRYGLLSFREGRLVGGILVNQPAKGPKLLRAIREGLAREQAAELLD